jgi:hypothetical protein
MFQMTYFAICTHFINFHESFNLELPPEPDSSPLFPTICRLFCKVSISLNVKIGGGIEDEGEGTHYGLTKNSLLFSIALKVQRLIIIPIFQNLLIDLIQ